MIWPFKHTRSISNEERSSGIEAMAEVIAKLKSECQSHRERADRYWVLYNNLKKEIENGSVAITEDLPPYVISNYIKNHSIPYRLEEDSDYIRLFSQEKGATISFRREFDKSKMNYNWVDKGSALITLIVDGFNLNLYNPTIIKSPASGIFESDNNKIIQYDEEICRIRKYDSSQKESVIEELEREAIKKAVYQRERKKMIERIALDELIAEGLVFNVFTTKDGHREPIPSDIANAVWNRDGGQCCICGSRSELEFDHIIPISKGGATTFRNLQLLCKKCNTRKSDRI